MTWLVTEVHYRMADKWRAWKEAPMTVVVVEVRDGLLVGTATSPVVGYWLAAGYEGEPPAVGATVTVELGGVVASAATRQELDEMLRGVSSGEITGEGT